MIAVFLKKTFWDGWDHLYFLALANVGFLVLATASITAFAAFGFTLPGLAALAALGPAAGVHACACACALKRVADGEKPRAAAWLDGLRLSWRSGLMGGAAAGFAVAAAAMAVPYYLALGGLAGALALGAVLWAAATALLALQWHPAVVANLGPRGALRECFAILFGNIGFSLFLAAWNLGTIVLSFFAAFLAPGFAGTTLAAVEGLRMLLKRYDRLESAGAAGAAVAGASVPWNELLADDIASMEGRSVKDAFLFGRKERRGASK